MTYTKENLTINDLIAVLVSLKTRNMSPPPHLELHPTLAHAMKNYSSYSGEAEISGSVSIDENGNAVGKVEFSCRC